MKEINTYLSIDIDYWGAYPGGRKKSLYSFMQRIDVLNVPIKVVVSHEEILRHLNKYKIKKLINIDYHSDIANEDTRIELNDGTWANFYEHKKETNFIWHHPMPPNKTLSGRCDDWTCKKWKDIICGYNNIEAKHTLRGLNLHGVGEICFAVSPSYLRSDMSWLSCEYPGIFGAFAQELAGSCTEF